MLKLYGQYKSRAFRVCWMLKESNVPYEHVNITIYADDASAKSDWYAKLNPNGRIPTIDDEGFVMWESTAINFYLAEKFNSPLSGPPMSPGVVGPTNGRSTSQMTWKCRWSRSSNIAFAWRRKSGTRSWPTRPSRSYSVS